MTRWNLHSPDDCNLSTSMNSAVSSERRSSKWLSIFARSICWTARLWNFSQPVQGRESRPAPLRPISASGSAGKRLVGLSHPPGKRAKDSYPFQPVSLSQSVFHFWRMTTSLPQLLYAGLHRPPLGRNITPRFFALLIQHL